MQIADPSAKVEADLPTRMVQVETSADSSALLEALAEAGFPATLREGAKA